MRFRLLIATVLLAASAVTASALPITYTEIFIGSGALGGVSFTNQFVTLTGIGDTTNVTPLPNLFENIVTGKVQIGSGKVDPFTDIIEVFDGSAFAPPLGLVGFADMLDVYTNQRLGVDIEATLAAPFLSYDLGGAVSGTGNDALLNPGYPFKTVLGNFDLTSVSGSTTFSSTLVTAATPEPSTIAFLGTGVLGLIGLTRRKLS